MFDDQPTTNQPIIDDEVIQPQNFKVNSTAADPSVAPSPFQPKKEDQELEDIFNSSDPIKPTLTQFQSTAVDTSEKPVDESQLSNAASTTPANAAVDLPKEPAIKHAPSVFKKLAETPTTSPEPTVDSAMPPMPVVPEATSANKKNIVIFIILIIIILVLSATAYWFFVLRKTTTPTASPINLFEEESFDNNLTPISQKDDLPPVSNLEVQDKDTDGDGLYDEAELLLGTSINSSDTDNDGLSDKDEVKIYKTDPLKPDTDNDGWNDSEEINSNTDPLEMDSVPQLEGHYVNNQYKLEFTLLPDMVFEGDDTGILRFNDNINQIKLYIYLFNTYPDDLTPDVSYMISEDPSGNLVIINSQQNEDVTPYSTDLSTHSYPANNGLIYLIRYVATKRADNHLENFEQILQSFNFKK